MFFIAHAGHWPIGLLESVPLLIVAGVAAWRTYADRRSLRVRSTQSRSGAEHPLGSRAG